MKKLSKITESIWSDMQDRSAGDVVRREDDVNLMSEEDFCDYLNDNYICKDGYRTYRIYYDSKVLHITVLKKFINVSYSITYDYKTNMIYLNDDIEDFVPELCQKLKNNFKVVKKIVGDSYTKFIIYPSDGSECTNRFFVDVINFIIDNADENVLLLKKKHINESIWSDMQDRSAGDAVRKEDVGKYITIDGVKWVLSKDFWDLGNEYNDENSDEWRCFAFNKPKDGTNIVRGNGEDTGVFGYDRWDIGEDKYDVYVIDDFINYTTADKFIDYIVNRYHCFDDLEKEIYDILVKYVRKVFDDKHMSEFAYYIIYEHWGSTRDGGCETPIEAYVELHPTELPVEKVDFEYNKEDIESIHYLDYVMLDNWYKDLRSELISTYQKLGYIWLKDYELDPFDSPGNTEGLCFVKIKNVRYEETK